MKKLFLVFAFAFTLTTGASAQAMMNCAQFCVLSINNLDTTANEIDVTIWNSDTVHVNYPTIVVVDGSGDTVINIGNYFYLFAHMAGDTLTQTIPTDWDSIPTGFTGTVYLTDQVWDTTCSFSYPMACTVGINELASANSLLLYPNPATDLINLNMTGMKGSEVSVYDMTGKLVRRVSANADQLSIERGDLRSGIYFVDVILKNKRITQKVVLE